MSIFSMFFRHKNNAAQDALTTYPAMPKVAKFEKVSYDEYKKSVLKFFPNSPDDEIQKSYDEIVMPERATTGSAGYDIHTPTTFTLNAGDAITFPTGLRCQIAPGWVMLVFPRSGHGFKWYSRLANTVGVIDADYYYADNEGHIMVKLRRESDAGDIRQVGVNAGDAVVQAVFVPFGITKDDSATGVRHGGFGSTGQ